MPEKVKYKILTIDDDPQIRKNLKLIIESKFNFTVIEAGTGKEGLQKIEEEKPFLVMLDIMMPDMSGTEVLQHIRNKSEIKNLPVMIISAVSDRELIRQLMIFGITDFVLKPIRSIQLINKIQEFYNNFLQKLETESLKPKNI